MKFTLRTVLVPTTIALLAASGCSTMSPHSAHPGYVGHAADARGPAADEALIQKFADALASRSGLGSEQAVEDALTRVVNDNASALSISKIDSLDDIAAMSDADQSRIIKALANLPELTDKLALDSQAADVARGEALAAQDVKGVNTEAVPNLRGGDTAPQFGKFVANHPEFKDDIQLMLRQNSDIQQKTGVTVLQKGCDSLSNPASVENLATVITDLDHDVSAGQATDEASVAKSLQSDVESVLGVDAEKAHEDICVLSDSNECGVLSPKMCR